MVETNNNATATDGTPGAGANPAAPQKHTSQSAPATDGAGVTDRQSSAAGGRRSSPKSGAIAALARAEERIAAQRANGDAPAGGKSDTTNKPESPGTQGVRAGARQPNSSEPSGQADTSAQANGSGDGAGATGAAADTTDAGDTASPTAPQDWPESHKERFSALASDTARYQVLDFYKGFQSAFTRAKQELNEERERRKELFSLDEQFANDPKAVIQALAQRASLPVFFEQSSSNEIPTFENSKDLLEHINKETERKLKEALKREKDASQTQARKAQASESLRAELKAAVTAHADFDSHREAVYQKLTEAQAAISVEDAYRLVTFDALAKQVAEGRKAQAELTALKAKQETAAKRSTMPVRGAGHGNQVIDDKHKSRGTRAFERAEQRVAAAR